MRSGNAPVYFDRAEQLTDTILGRVGKNIVLALPLGLGKANHVANSMFRRAAGNPSMALRIFTALTLGKPRAKQDLERRFLDPVSARLFDGYPALAYGEALRDNRMPQNVEVDNFFSLPAADSMSRRHNATISRPTIPMHAATYLTARSIW